MTYNNIKPTQTVNLMMRLLLKVNIAQRISYNLADFSLISIHIVLAKSHAILH